MKIMLILPLVCIFFSLSSCINKNIETDLQNINSYLVTEIVSQHVWNFDNEALESFVNKLFTFDSLQAIFIYSETELILVKIHPKFAKDILKLKGYMINSIDQSIESNASVLQKVLADSDRNELLNYIEQNEKKLGIVKVEKKLISNESSTEIGKIIIFYIK
jgi:hypothetical protein